jgi:hypothetical protein
MTDEELIQKIDDVTKDYKGQIDHLAEAVGLIVLGRLFGWKVMRLVCSRRSWMLASRLFGDPKELMIDRGKYANKSVGLRLVDQVGGYWDLINGKINALPLHDRKTAD